MQKPKPRSPDKWDKYAIKAEISRRGKSLKQLSLEGGLSESAVRMALISPVPAAEKLIAEFIQQPVHLLWPDRYTDPALTNVSTSKPTSSDLSPDDDGDGNGILVRREAAA